MPVQACMHDDRHTPISHTRLSGMPNQISSGVSQAA